MLSAAIVAPAAGAPALTGIVRLGGQWRGFFSDSVGGRPFSLSPGEAVGNVRLLRLSPGERRAWVVIDGETNELTFDLTRPPEAAATSVVRKPMLHSTGRRTAFSTMKSDPESAGAEAADPAPKDPAERALAEEALAAMGSNPTETPPGARRQPTPQELYRIQYGDQAWGDLLLEHAARSTTATAQPTYR